VTARSAFLAQLGFVKGQDRSHFEECMAKFWASVQSQRSSIESAVETVSEAIVEKIAEVATVLEDVISRAGIHVGQRIKGLKNALKIAGKRVVGSAIQILNILGQTCHLIVFNKGSIEKCEVQAHEVEAILYAKSKAHRRDTMTADLFA
jgi:hypothetical protein